MKLEILEPSTREAGAILVCDEDHNDIAEFYHSEHATVDQSYEMALMLASKLVEAANSSDDTIRTLPATPGESVNDFFRNIVYRLTPADQYDLAFKLAENIGYIIAKRHDGW